MSIEQDTYLPFCQAPMGLQLPKGFPLASARLGATACPITVTDKGVFVDVPVQKAFADGCAMTLKKPETMTIPEDMPVTLTIKNTSAEALDNIRLRWSASVGMEVTGGPSAPFSLAAGAEREIAATVRTRRGERRGIRPKGARFGLAPISAFVTATAGKAERTFLASWEVLVAPRLRVEMDPRHVPIPKGQSFPVFVHLANGRVDRDRAWGRMHHEKLIDHRTGPCKGTVGFLLPEGVVAEPASQTFDLPADPTGTGGHATFRFLIKNTQWGDDKPVYLRPAVRFAGEADPIEVPWYGTALMRDKAAECKPVNTQGLLAHAAWDDRKNTRANLDQAAGSKIQSCPGASGGGSTPSHEGIKAWCLGWNSNVAFDALGNIDYRRGTVMFWTRRDPRVRNDIGTRPDPKTSWQVPGAHKNYGEKLFCVGLNRDLILRRYAKYRDKEGYLELALAEMPVRGRKTKIHYLQVPFETDKLYDWRHVAIVWDVKQRRLELYLDGQLVGRADKGAEEWLILPWDRGRKTHDMVIVETHHGHWSGSMRDEFYVYNRPLTAKEIRENLAKGKAKE